MFGIGPQEVVVIGLLLLVVFGPGKLPSIARDLGRFVNEARRPVEELKSELTSSGEGRDEPASSSRSGEEGAVREPGKRRKPPPPEEEAHPMKAHAPTEP